MSNLYLRAGDYKGDGPECPVCGHGLLFHFSYTKKGKKFSECVYGYGAMGTKECTCKHDVEYLEEE